MPQDRLRSPRGSHGRRLTSLSDFEFRVWDQYQLSADDFGVMRLSAITVQADNDALADRAPADVQAALERLVSVGLVAAFEHQDRRYVCQLDWQTFQKVEYPRLSSLPQPPEELLAHCDALTRRLFLKHPGGWKKRRGKRGGAPPDSAPRSSRGHTGTLPEGSLKVAQTAAEHSENIRRKPLAVSSSSSREPLAVSGSPIALAGALPRDHARHAFCGRKCVPDFLHGEFVRGIGGDPADADVRLRGTDGVSGWYGKVDASLPVGPIGDEPMRFWRTRFTADFPSALPTPGRTAGADAASRRIPTAEQTAADLDAERRRIDAALAGETREAM